MPRPPPLLAPWAPGLQQHPLRQLRVELAAFSEEAEHQSQRQITPNDRDAESRVEQAAVPVRDGVRFSIALPRDPIEREPELALRQPT